MCFTLLAALLPDVLRGLGQVLWFDRGKEPRCDAGFPHSEIQAKFNRLSTIPDLTLAPTANTLCTLHIAPQNLPKRASTLIRAWRAAATLAALFKTHHLSSYPSVSVAALEAQTM